MLTIYHNPRCRKSREAFQYLEAQGLAFNTRLYLTDPLTTEQLEVLIKKLGISPQALVRTGEAIWKTQFKGQDLSPKATIKAMVDYPKLIERPIIESDKRACVGRPLSNVEEFLAKLKQ